MFRHLNPGKLQRFGSQFYKKRKKTATKWSMLQIQMLSFSFLVQVWCWERFSMRCKFPSLCTLNWFNQSCTLLTFPHFFHVERHKFSHTARLLRFFFINRPKIRDLFLCRFCKSANFAEGSIVWRIFLCQTWKLRERERAISIVEQQMVCCRSSYFLQILLSFANCFKFNC